MKKLILSTVLAICTLATFAQDNTINAFLKSYSYESSQDYSKAINELNAVYTDDSYTINLRLGWLYYLNGDYLKSQSFYKKSIKLKPNSIEARLGYAYPTAALENWNDVISNYKDILKIDSNNTLVNYRLGYIYFYISKNTEIALVYVQKVLSLHPFDFDSNFLLANIQVSLGNIKEAKDAIVVALQCNPSSKEAQILYESVK